MNQQPDTPFSRPTSARSRRAAERRAAQRRADVDAAMRLGQHYTDPSAPELIPIPGVQVTDVGIQVPTVGEVRRARTARPVNPVRRLAFYAIATAVAVDATLLLGTPVLGQPWNWLRLALGAVLTVLLAERTWHWARRNGVRARSALLVLSALLVALFVVGSLNQVVINGRPYLAGSDTAQAYRLGEDIVTDLRVIRDNDRYFNLPTEQARTYASEIAAAATSSQEVADRWNPSVARDLPSPAFSSVLRDVNSSASAQAQALTALREDLDQPDAGRESQIDVTRRNSVASFISATDELRSATNLYGFDLTYNEGPVE